MKYTLLLIVSLALVSCNQPTDRQKLDKALGNPSQKSAINNYIDGVVVMDQVIGYSMSERDAKSVISAFRQQYPDYTLSMVSSSKKSTASLIAKDSSNKSKMFSANKTKDGWKF